MTVTIKPSVARGKVAAPPSKSMAHRLLIAAGLSNGKSVIKGISPSKDVTATLNCLKALGAEYEINGDTVILNGIDRSAVKDGAVLDCFECGSTLRFFIPIALTLGKEITFVGSERLFSRPLAVYEDICKKEGFKFELSSSSLCLFGNLHAGKYTVAGNVSSQFISGLIFALSLLSGESVIEVLPPVESRSYIDMTISAVKEFGIKICEKEENVFYLGGNGGYSAKNATVEGDYSNAAFFEALNLAGGSVTVYGLDEESLQGDKIYKEYFECLKSGDDELDISNCPDLGPVLFAAAALLKGGRFSGTARLKIKESDRAEAMKEELSKFGVAVSVFENSVTVSPSALKAPTALLSSHNDHRIAMALSVLLTVTGGSISGAESVEKSFPDFFDRLASLGIEVDYNEKMRLSTERRAYFDKPKKGNSRK